MDGCSWSGGGLAAVGGREFAELRDGGGDGFEGVVDFRLRGVAAEAETDAGARRVGREADGREDVRRLDGAGRASRAGGAGDALHVEGDDEGFAFDSRESDVGGVWRSRRAGGVDAGVRDAGDESLFESVAKRGDA